MIQWEYETFDFQTHLPFFIELEKLGKEGWELVTVQTISTTYSRAFFKRSLIKN